MTGRGRMSYRPMFGSHDSRADRVMNAVFDQARRFLVDGSRHDRYLTVAVVDCGGFTLDLAKLVLDLKVTDYAELPFDVVTSHSYDVGISTAIDDRCLGPILRRHGVGIDSLSFEALEIAKYELLAGREHNLFHQAKILALGRAEEDRKAVAQGLRSYCSEAWRFLARTEWDDVEYAFLTGGGVNIGKVREYLTQSLEEAGVGSVTCLHGGGAGRDAIASAGDYLRSAEAADDFGRLGTAVGDASIALGFDTRAA